MPNAHEPDHVKALRQLKTLALWNNIADYREILQRAREEREYAALNGVELGVGDIAEARQVAAVLLRQRIEPRPRRDLEHLRQCAMRARVCLGGGGHSESKRQDEAEGGD